MERVYGKKQSNSNNTDRGNRKNAKLICTYSYNYLPKLSTLINSTSGRVLREFRTTAQETKTLLTYLVQNRPKMAAITPS